MTTQDFLKNAAQTLKSAGIASARLDVLILLEDVLGVDRAAILAHPETEITSPQLSMLNKQVTQRSKHVPLAYIRGRAPVFLAAGWRAGIGRRLLLP